MVDEQAASVVAFAQELIRIPSQGGVDELQPVLHCVHDWLRAHNIPSQLLCDDRRQEVAVLGEVGSGSGPTYCLDACIDTAPIGDGSAWRADPLGAEVVDGRLHGRGAADSKTAVSVFAHIATQARDVDGRLLVLFDGDEHSGAFAGIKSFVARVDHVDGVMIGYPGNDRVTIGSRGFFRARVRLFGRGGHSGGRRKIGVNAVTKAARLVTAIAEAELPEPSDPKFPLYPSVTVTGIDGGTSFSMIPDRCEVRVDARLTPDFSREDARAFLERLVARADAEMQGRARAELIEAESWPHYRLSDNERVAVALREAASAVKGVDVPFAVSGPSNVGNFLAAHGIAATCGFGATYENIHAPNENVEIASIPLVLETYRGAVRRLFA